MLSILPCSAGQSRYSYSLQRSGPTTAVAGYSQSRTALVLTFGRPGTTLCGHLLLLVWVLTGTHFQTLLMPDMYTPIPVSVVLMVLTIILDIIQFSSQLHWSIHVSHGILAHDSPDISIWGDNAETFAERVA